VRYKGSLTLTGSSCSTQDKSNLEALLKVKFQQTGLCLSQSCTTDNVNFAINCYISGKTKRSTEPIQFTIDFSIANDEYV